MPIDPHSPSKYDYVPQPEDVVPTVERIFDELWVLTLPNSPYSSARDTTVPFVDGCKEGLSNACCAAHIVSNIAVVRKECHLASEHCSCNDETLHEFLRETVKIIDKHMSKCIHDILVKKILHERTN